MTSLDSHFAGGLSNKKAQVPKSQISIQVTVHVTEKRVS